MADSGRATIVVVSGGQPGAELGGLRAARSCGLATAGVMPFRCKVDGKCRPDVAMEFGLTQATRPWTTRTVKSNVRNSDFVAWFGDPLGWRFRTVCREADKRGIRVLAIDSRSDPVPPFVEAAWKDYMETPLWSAYNVMVAGSRESKAEGIQAAVEEYLVTALPILCARASERKF